MEPVIKNLLVTWVLDFSTRAAPFGLTFSAYGKTLNLTDVLDTCGILNYNRFCMSAIYRLPITVPSSAIDRLGHVNNVVYVQWMQDAAVSHSNHVGCTKLSQESNAAWVARTHTIEYLRPAFAGEEIHVLTWVADFRKVRSTRKYKFIRASDEVVLATAATDWVYVNLQSGKPLSIPVAIQELFTLAPDPV